MADLEPHLIQAGSEELLRDLGFDYDPEPISMKSFKLMGTGTEDNHTVITINLQIVSTACNIFTIGMCLYLINNLYVAIRDSKSTV